MVNILLVVSVLANIILIIKVINQKKELNEFYDEDEKEYEKSVNEDNFNNDSSNTDKINYIYKYIRTERDNLLSKLKDSNLNYQAEYTNFKKQLNEKDEVIKKQEEQIQNLLNEISNIQTIKEQEEKLKKVTKRKKKTQEKEEIEIDSSKEDNSSKKNSEKDLVSLLFEKEENKRLDSKLAKMQKGELLNYFTNLFNTLRNGDPSNKEVQETYTNAIKDIRDYEEAKQISTGLVTEEGKLKMRSLMNYIDQLQM